METTYCAKRKKKKLNVLKRASGYKTVKNGRLIFCCTCASCGIKKYRFVMKKGNLLARGEADTIAGSALPDMFVTRGLPFMGEKAVEMTRGQFNKTITPVIYKYSHCFRV